MRVLIWSHFIHICVHNSTSFKPFVISYAIANNVECLNDKFYSMLDFFFKSILEYSYIINCSHYIKQWHRLKTFGIVYTWCILCVIVLIVSSLNFCIVKFGLRQFSQKPFPCFIYLLMYLKCLLTSKLSAPIQIVFRFVQVTNVFHLW